MTGIRTREGVTLPELLVTLAVLAILLAALLAATHSTLTAAHATKRGSERTLRLQTVGAYVSDRARAAAHVIPSITINPSSAPDGGACDLEPATGLLPCLALVVPEARNGLEIDTYLLLAYRLERRSDLPDAYKEPDRWADDNSFVLKEYRSVLCPSSTRPICSGTPPVPSTVVGAQWYLVADRLTLDAGDGSLYPPFQIIGTHELELRLRFSDRVRGTVHHTPPREPRLLRTPLTNLP